MMPELAKRIAFTLGALLIFRLGTNIPLPGLDLAVLFNQNHSGLPRMANTASSVAIAPLSIFALGIFPYITAAIVIQLIALVSSRFNAIAKRGAAGRRVMARYTLGLTIFLTALQAFGIARGLESASNLVSQSGGIFLLSTTVTLVGGTIFLIWLSEQITVRGVGNGLALILSVGIVMQFAAETAKTIELGWRGALSGGNLLVIAALAVGFIAFIVFVERARRYVPLEFAGRQVGDRAIPPVRSYLSLKLNGAGLIPAVVAPWFVYLPLTVAGPLFGSEWLRSNQGWLAATLKHMLPGQPAHMIYTVLAVIILALIYTAFVVDPENAADSLKRNGAVIPGIAPGEATAEHLDRVVSYTTFAGAPYLVAVLLIPEALIAYANVPYYFAGASALILVCAVLDIEAQVRGRSLTARGDDYP
jgi:preprotein translocase subunit SecY